MLPKDRPYLIGETAFHHEGNKTFLFQLIEHGADIGLDAIKLHLLFDLEDYMIAEHDAIESLRAWCLSPEDWSEVLAYVSKKNLEAVLLCNDVKSAEWAIEHQAQVRAVEVHATGINDVFLLEKVSRFAGTVMLGTGGSTVDELQFAIDFLRAKGQEDIFLMHGFQNYPTDFADINLSKMRLLQHLFRLPIGYADHTDPNEVDNEVISVLGLAMGCNVLEKHFTHHFGEKRIDAQAAVSIAQMKRIKTLALKVHQAYGSEDMRMSEGEKNYGNTGPMKKAIVARRPIASGEEITMANVAFKRTNQSATLNQLDLPRLLGLKANRLLKKDELIDFSNVDYQFQKTNFSQFFKSDQ